MRKHKSPLSVIFLTIFIDLLGIGILFPVIPQLLANPDSPEYLLPHGMSLQHGYILLGLLSASYPIAQFFAAPILGQLSDMRGRRPILLVSLFGTAIGYALFALAILTRNIPLLFASRILDGITGGNISVAQAAIADVTTPENRAKNFGLMGAVFGLGFILGPFIGGQLADSSVVSWFSPATPFWFAAGLAILNMTLLFFLLPETRKHLSHGRIQWSQSLQHIAKAFNMPKLRAIFTVGFLYQSGFSFFVSFFGVFMIQRYGFQESDIGRLFAYIGIWIAITQGGVTQYVAKRWNERKVLTITMIATGLALLLFLIPGPWTVMLWTVPIFAVVNGLAQANFMGFLSRSAGEDVQGEVLGINASIAALSQSLPPILSGIIAAESAPWVTIVIASVIVTCAGIVFVVKLRKAPLGAAHGPTMAVH
jgi:DHA1 family tetracycline resistance protein-like MFS transporter